MLDVDRVYPDERGAGRDDVVRDEDEEEEDERVVVVGKDRVELDLKRVEFDVLGTERVDVVDLLELERVGVEVIRLEEELVLPGGENRLERVTGTDRGEELVTGRDITGDGTDIDGRVIVFVRDVGTLVARSTGDGTDRDGRTLGVVRDELD